MGRYRDHYIEGSGENLRIRKEQTVEAPSLACEQSPACAQHPGANLCHMEAWEVFPVGES